MSGIGAAIIGGSVITGGLSAWAQSNAADKAAAAQQTANANALGAQQNNYQQGVAYQNNILNRGDNVIAGLTPQLQALFAPYLAAGNTGINGAGGLTGIQRTGGQALAQQAALSGASGNAAQQTAIQGVQGSPYFNALLHQGEDAILQNQSATGMLRSGNTAAQEGYFAPQLLQGLLQQQFQNLSSISGMGGAAAGTLAGLGSSAAGTQGGLQGQLAGQQLGLLGNTGGNVAGLSGANTQAVTNLMGQQGQISANNALAQGNALTGMFNGVNSSVDLAALLRGGAFGPRGLAAGGQTMNLNPSTSSAMPNAWG